MLPSQALDAFLRAKEAKGLSPNTITWYRIQIEILLRQIADQWPQPEDIEALYAVERKRIIRVKDKVPEASSLAGLDRALRAWFNWCVSRKYIGESPMLVVERPKVPKKKPRNVTAEEFDKLVASIPSTTWVDIRDKLAINVLFLCGLRLAEVTNLVLGDFKTSEGLLLVRHGKGGDDRLVPLMPAVIRSLLEYIYARPVTDTDKVFLSANGILGPRDVLTPNGLRQMVRRRCAAAGVEYRNPHAFRHGLAIYILNNGGDISLVKRILGHSHIQTTEIYARWMTDGVIQAFSEVVERSDKKNRRASAALGNRT